MSDEAPTAQGSRLLESVKTLDRRFLSLGLYQAWVFLTFHSSTVIPIGTVQYDYAYSVGAGTAVLALIIGLVYHYSRPARVRTLIAATAFGILGTVFVYAFRDAPTEWCLVSCALLGAGMGLLLPFVGKLYSSANLRSVMIQTLAGYVFAIAVYFFVLGMPTPVNLAIAALLPAGLAAVLLTHRPHRHPQTPAGTDAITALLKSRPIVLFAVGIGVLSAAFAFSMALCGAYDPAVFRLANQWGLLFAAFLAVIVGAWFLVSGAGFSFERYFRPVVPLIVVGFLMLRMSVTFAGTLVIGAFQLADMLIWVVLSWLSSHAGLPQKVFCVGKGAAYAGMVLGSVTIGLIRVEPGAGSEVETVTTIVAYLLLLAAVFIFSNSTVNLAIKTSSDDNDAEFITRSVELKCQQLGERFDLTCREREVLSYLAQGRTLPYIEKELHLSHGTVSSHRDHIYTKLDVHSRQELLDLFSEIIHM